MDPSLADLACEAAAQFADEVDRDARFPIEALDQLRAARLLGAMVPRELGGLGFSLTQVCLIVERLARACSSTAMVFAMHQIQVACLVNHQRTGALDVLLKQIAAEQLLVASATTERAVSGSVRTSVCCVTRTGEDGGHFGEGSVELVKEASIISYARAADAILVTARRALNAAPTDQVLVAIVKHDYSLEATNQWDTLGFRGTESAGFVLRATAPAEYVFDDPFADISRRTMLPVSHLVWASLWVGLAAEAVSRARRLLRQEARKQPGVTPAMALGVGDLVNRLQELRSLAYDAAHDYERAVEQWHGEPTNSSDSPLRVDSLGFSIRMNGLKLAGSKAVVELITDAIEVCGMPAYQASGPYSLGRLLRDAHGARVMINNNRLAAANAAWLLVSKEE